tara:strand:+ start:879 stop:989 length:111 start_codon:yes stop_codon:yes gene_type:complete
MQYTLGDSFYKYHNITFAILPGTAGGGLCNYFFATP